LSENTPQEESSQDEAPPSDNDNAQIASVGVSMAELEAYVDEGLAAAEMSRIEAVLRAEPKLVEQLAAVLRRRDAGVHSLGEIWRRGRLSCPTREQLGSYLLGVAGQDVADFIEFHTQVSGCRFCLANLDDLKQRRDETDAAAATRRTKYFQSSAGFLRKDSSSR